MRHTPQKKMTQATVFCDILNNGTVMLQPFCGLIGRPRNVRRFGTRRGFVGASLHPDVQGAPLSAFFEQLGKMGQIAYTTISIQRGSVGHCIPLFFFRRGAAIFVEVTEVRGSAWPALSNFYDMESLLAAVQQVLTMCNLYRRSKRQLELRFRLLRPLRHRWAAYLVAGDGYCDRWPALYQGHAVNCRVAALSYIWMRARPGVKRVTAVARLKRYGLD